MTSLPREFLGFAILALVAFTQSASYAAKGDCSQPVSTGSGPAASDCLFILKVAVGTETCVPECVCAPQGGPPVQSSDALRCLRKAVGQDVTLECGCTENHGIVRVHYPADPGDTIELRGSGGGLSTQDGLACDESEPDLWICDLGVASGQIEFEPRLNDSIPAAGTDYLLTAPGEIDIYPFFIETTGRVDILEDVDSVQLDNTRDVAVYLPPSYDENSTKRYPILFMQDGQNLFDAATAFGGVEWGVDEALDTLATGGDIRETIVVAPYSSASRLDEYTPTFDDDFGAGGDGDAYLDFLLEELRPQIDSLYRTDTGAAPGIAGSSLGGLLAIYGAWTRHPPFDRVAALSPSLFWDDAFAGTLIANDDGPKVALRIYLDVGSNEPNVELVDDLVDSLVAKGWVIGDDLQHVLAPGQSANETAWASRTPGAMAFLLRDPDRSAP